MADTEQEIERKIAHCYQHGLAAAVKFKDGSDMLVLGIESYLPTAEIKTVRFRSTTIHGKPLDVTTFRLSSIERFLPLGLPFDHPSYVKMRALRADHFDR